MKRPQCNGQDRRITLMHMFSCRLNTVSRGGVKAGLAYRYRPIYESNSVVQLYYVTEGLPFF